jgi:hypothetical protein
MPESAAARGSGLALGAAAARARAETEKLNKEKAELKSLSQHLADALTALDEACAAEVDSAAAGTDAKGAFSARRVLHCSPAILE